MPQAVWSLLASNHRYRARPGMHRASPVPERELVVLTCMDARLDLEALLDLRVGDAQILRNAGGRVTTDVLRSMAMSTRTMAVREVGIIQHTGCGLEGKQNSELSRHTGLTDVDFFPFRDVYESVRADVVRAATSRYLPDDTDIWGAVCRLHERSVSLVCWPEAVSVVAARSQMRGHKVP